MTGVNLFIKGLQNADNGRYTCAATYASTTPLEKTVNLTTIGKLFSNSIHQTPDGVGGYLPARLIDSFH